MVNLDESGKTARAFIDKLNTSGGYSVKLYSQDKAESDFSKKAIFRYLVIPSGFSQSVEASQPVSLQLIALDVQSSNTQSALLAITGVVRDLSLKTQLIASLTQMGEMQASAPKQFQVFTSEILVQQA